MDQRELTSFPCGQITQIAAYVAGAKAVLKQILTGADDPMDIDIEFRDTGNCHIYLIRGKWVKPYEASF